MKSLIGIALLAAATPAAAQGRHWGTSGAWQVSLEPAYCSFTTTRPDGAKITLNRYSTMPNTGISITPAPVAGRNMEEGFPGAGAYFRIAGARASQVTVEPGRGYAMAALTPAILRETLASGTIRVSGAGASPDTIVSLPPSPSLERDFEACLADLRIAERGSGEAQRVAPRPRKPLTPLFEDPAPGWEHFRGGRLHVQVTVAAQGHPLACTVIDSTGEPMLDDYGCKVIMGRTSFVPATDAAGRPTLGIYDFAITWKPS